MPSQEYLLRRFEYNPETGILRWRPVTLTTHHKPTWWNGMYAGKAVGSSNPDGHLMVHLDYKRFGIARVIWKMAYGTEPAALIDHRDLNPKNNILTNLREATRAQNNSNVRTRPNNTSGFKGAYYHPTTVKGKVYPRWAAQISVNGKKIHLGSFKSMEAAAEAYRVAAIKYHGEFARLE